MYVYTTVRLNICQEGKENLSVSCNYIQHAPQHPCGGPLAYIIIIAAALICYNRIGAPVQGEERAMASEHDGAYNDIGLLVRAAESYYLENKTQAQIAKLLGVSPSTVSRLLSRAREEGVVRIAIVRPQGRNDSLEQTLRQRFGIDESIVASVAAGASDDDAVRRVISAVAAPYVDA